MAKAELASYINSLHTFDLSGFGTNFEKRLELQKVVYLLQEAGADLGYHFGWYIHGPYSSSLADDAYPLSSSGKFLKTFQSPVNERALTKFKSLIDSVSGTKKRTYWLELLSSVHYVTKHSFPIAETKKEAIDSIVKVKRGKFSPQDIAKAYDLLETKSFI